SHRSEVDADPHLELRPGRLWPLQRVAQREAHVERVLRIAEEGERRTVAGVEDDAVVGRDVRKRLRQQRVQPFLEEDLLGDGLLRVLAHVEKPDAADEGAVDRGLHYLTRMPGWAPGSGESKYIPAPSREAASTMPSETPNFILRGARLATATVRRPLSVTGSYADLMPANTVRVAPPTSSV